MQISLQTVLYFLKWQELGYAPQMALQAAPGLDWEHCFSDVVLLEPDMGEGQEDFLYVGTVSDVEQYVQNRICQSGRLHAVVLTESEKSAEFEKSAESEKTTGSVGRVRCLPEWVRWICVPQNTGLVKTYNQIREIFHRILSWDKRLDDIILTGQDMNVMLETYTELLPHHLLMWDASFNICAYTKNIPAPNARVEEMERKGYFLPETVEFLVHKNLIAKSTDIGTRYFNPDMLPSGNQALIHHYFRQGLRFYSVCIYAGDDQTFERGIMGLIEYFFGRLNFYLDKHAPAYQGQHFLYESFLIGLLEGTLTDSAVIAERAKSFRIRPTGTYRLYCLRINDYKITLARYLIETVASSAPDVKLLQYQNHVLMLKAQSSRSARTEEEKQNWLERITRLLMIHNAYCGVSSEFSHLKEIRTAYGQACSALESGLMLCPQEKSRIYFYRDYYLYHLLKKAENDIPLPSLYPGSLDSMLEQDLERGSNNLRLLETYLKNNQSVTATARQMYMHRNSVIYRVRKIEEMLGVSLENHDDAFRLDFSVCVLRYLFWTNKNYEKYRCLLEEKGPAQQEYK